MNDTFSFQQQTHQHVIRRRKPIFVVIEEFTQLTRYPDILLHLVVCQTNKVWKVIVSAKIALFYSFLHSKLKRIVIIAAAEKFHQGLVASFIKLTFRGSRKSYTPYVLHSIKPVQYSTSPHIMSFIGNEQNLP